MSKTKNLYQSFNSIGVGFFMACTIGLIAVIWPTSKNTVRQNSQLQLINETLSLQVTSLERKGDSIHLVLKNGYMKDITGFQVRVGNVTIQSEFIGSDEVFPPGVLYERVHSVQNGIDEKGIAILAVVFDDGSSDGNPKYINQIKYKRLGEKTQISHALPFIQKVLDASAVNWADSLKKLKSEIQSLEVKQSNQFPEDFVLGLHDRKLQLIRQIETIQSKKLLNVNLNIRDELMQLKEKHHKQLSKLSN